MEQKQAAPVVTQTPKKKSIRSVTKKPTLKTNLCTPYSVKWPLISTESTEFVLHELKSTLQRSQLLSPMDLLRTTDPAAYKEYKRKKKADKKTFRIKKTQEMKEAEGYVNLRPQLALGFDVVMKSLERNSLRLLVASRESWELVRHLAQMSGVRGCPGMAIDGLSDAVGPLLGLKSLSVLGFKKVHEGDPSTFNDLVQTISSRCVPVELPWLGLEEELQQLKHSETVSGGEQEREGSLSQDEDSSLSQEREGSLSPMEEDGSDTDSSEADYSHFYVLKKDRKPNGPLVFENDAQKVFVKQEGFGKDGFVSFDDDETKGKKRKNTDGISRQWLDKGTKKKQKSKTHLRDMVLGKVQTNHNRASGKKAKDV